ncbi:Latrophilin-like protein 1 [Caenorhabditis elegans]|uniref:Isoform b of Latrophilin-like protein 1 n=1 Tax=Caenorhabditis elegans TaxID=6239 RepID=G5EDW2-2|nr:Latrophilin-like protein 1 [Caenorhabditis elegans]AAQ84878.1 latrophilin-like protein LAT-1B [Caenorhabditis elegans]CAD59141.1 Latrophilin-like protein 1 [Caenorhabditis elegans]|eukprot:NP_871949.1 Latrophilin-like protein 1 [Caenorhabditis elegans]
MRRNKTTYSLLQTILVACLLTVTPTFASNKPTTDESGTISHTICDGEAAELSCPAGKVISIVLGNYGRFSVAVCLPDNDIVPSNINCQNHKTKSILEKKCNGKQTCRFFVDTFLFDDACPMMSKYLEVQHECHEATTTTTTTTTSTTTTDSSLIVDEEEEAQKDALNSDVIKPVKKKEDVFCSATNRRGVNWQNTKSGTTSSAPCPEGSSGKQLWACTEEGQWLTEFPNSAGCESNWISSRNSVLSGVISSEDVSGLPEFLRNLGSETRRPMVGGDLPKVLHLLEKTVNVIAEESWAYQHLPLSNKGAVEVMNYMLRNQEIWGSWDVTKRKEFASRFILAAEKAMVASAKGMMTSAESNVIVQPAITVEISHKIKMSSQPTDYILFPSAALWNGQNVDNVNIPRDAILKINKDETQVFFSSFDNLGAQMTPSDVTVAIAGTDQTEVRKRRVVSRIVGASLIENGKERRVENLTQPVRITFYHKESSVRHLSNPTCVWWNHHELKWKPSGCKLSYHNKTMTSCDCTHLTHFAVLMDVRGHDLNEIDQTLLTLLTYVGCIISIICLLLTFFAYLIFSRNGGDRVFIHENLCLSLAIAEITFLAGITRTEDSLQCGIIAVALMYMFLSALTWMLLEGYHIHRMLTEVFPSDPRRFTYLLVGYIPPAIITLVAYLYNSDGFGTPDHCWLSTQNNFIWFFAGPACFIFCANSLVLVKTLCTVYQHTSGGYLPCRHDVDSGRSIRNWVKGSLALASLLGVTWIFGLFWVEDSRSIVMAYVFTISNSLQGLFIFLFHVVFAEKMRKDVGHWMYRRGCGGSSNSSPNHKRHNVQRDLMSPGVNSSTGSDFLYNTNDKYLTNSDTTNRLVYNGIMNHPNQMSVYQQHPHHQIYEQQPGTYDYATIAYGDMMPGHRVAAPPAYQRLAVAEGRYGSQHQLYQGWHHRPPPEFSPPPPPLSTGPPNSRHYGTGSSGRRPPSSKMSDDSAYSDGSSSMLTTEVTPQGQTVLRIDLNKPSMYCQDL